MLIHAITIDILNQPPFMRTRAGPALRPIGYVGQRGRCLQVNSAAGRALTRSNPHVPYLHRFDTKARHLDRFGASRHVSRG